MDWIHFLIYIHAAFGGLALVSGFISATSFKGSRVHTRAGIVFHHSMIVAILFSSIVALLPAHFNPFLLGIGVFSLYGVISGRRCLKVNKPNYQHKIDTYLAYFLILNCALMVGLPLVFQGKINIILTVFGSLGILAAVRDLLSFRDLDRLKADRIQHHINKISGGYIAAITAFLVVNELLPSYWAWFTPTVIGGVFATYYNVIYRNKKTDFINS